MNDLISILMGVYNAENTLHDAVASIQNQSYQNWELIICDDGSTDDTGAILHKYKDPRIKVIGYRDNIGLGYALNRCFELAQGSYIARMDADDISLPKRLEVELNYLNSHHECDVVATAITMFDENGDYCVRPIVEEPSPEDFLSGSPVAHPTVMMRRSILDDVGGYCETRNALLVEDIELWIRLIDKGCRFHVIKEPLLRYRYDYSSVKRQTMRSRINEAVVRIKGYNRLHLSRKYYYYAFRTVAIGLIPAPIRYRLQMKRLKR